jgi:uncharacterized repeat protein (TIGR03803 family)
MTTKKISVPSWMIVLVAMAAMSVATAWGATETVLYNFVSGTGKAPNGSLVFDAAGNIYGTTASGGVSNAGAVFQLHKTLAGVWIENVLYTFSGLSDGGAPHSGVIFDGAGNLYGTTSAGGGANMGTVFELSPNGVGGWTESVIYSFSGADGADPEARLLIDPSGNLYGTTASGGSANKGTVFELLPSGGGWVEAILHDFSGADGATPRAELIRDGSGNLYGTTASGGSNNQGTAFDLLNNGAWTEQIMHSFKGGSDGSGPMGGLYLDASSFTLYGSTIGGAGDGCGIVYQLSYHITSWTEHQVTFFYRGAPCNPIGTLAVDVSGNFYGSVVNGTFESGDNAGGVFSLDSGNLGVYYYFQGGLIEGKTHDGEGPQGGLIFDAAGNLYGSTFKGGKYAGGTVFELTP